MMLVHPLNHDETLWIAEALAGIDKSGEITLVGSVSVFYGDKHLGYFVFNGDTETQFTQEEPEER